MNRAIKVLVVEDSGDDAALAVRALSQGGFEPAWKRVETAADLGAALAAERWDAVVSDFSLPGFTGLDALHIVRAREPDLPFILVSGAVGENTAVALMKAGANDYVMKTDLSRLAPALARELEDAAARASSRLELERSERYHRKLIEQGADTYLVVGRDRKVVFFGEGSHGLTGFLPREIQGVDILELVAPGSRETVRVALERLGSRATEAVSIELQLPTRGEGELTVDARAINLRDDADVAGVVITLHDITQRKRVESALRESESTFRAFFEQSSVGVTQTDPDGRYRIVNDRFCALLGRARSEIVGRTFREFTYPGDIAADLAQLEKMRAGLITDFTTEKRYVRGDGTFQWVSLTVTPLRDVNGAIVRLITIVIDISERKRAEQERHDRTSRLELQALALSGLSCSERMLAGDVEGFAREATQLMASVTGVARANIWQFEAGDSRLVCLDLYEAAGQAHSSGQVLEREQYRNEFEALESGRCVVAEDPLTDPRTAGYVEGYLKPLGITSMLDAVVHVSGRNLGVICLEHVGTAHHWEPDEIDFALRVADKIALVFMNRARHDAQEALERTERYQRKLIEEGADTFFVLDREGILRYRSGSGESLTGWSNEEVIGRSVFDFVGKSLHEDAMLALGRLIRGEPGAEAVELNLNRKDGGALTVEARGRNLLDDPDVGGVVVTIRDVSARHAAAGRLRAALGDTIRALALAVEARDPYTAGHEQRVADLCVAIGTELDLPAERLEGLRLGALVHDIGKIYVPAEILNRPGRLSKPEFEMIKSHPEVGYGIVKDIDFPWPIAEMVRNHHERLDGSGYPRGLKGEAIDLESRILAVADVVEAISAHRPYRAALGIDKALEEVLRQRGTCFDAAVVDACVRLFREKGFSL